MVKLKLALELNYEIIGQGSDFIFNIHHAHTPYQRVVQENLLISQTHIKPEIYTDAATGNRYMRLHANIGHLKLNYERGAIPVATITSSKPCASKSAALTF